jgi:hypothetical protein
MSFWRALLDRTKGKAKPARQDEVSREAVEAEERRVFADAVSGVTLGVELDNVVQKLLALERYLEADGRTDPMARQIGEELYELGCGSIDLMKEAFARVSVRRGRAAAAELSACWDGIGAKTGVVPGQNAWID